MKTDADGKISGEEGILESAQVCSAGGHSKRTWLVVSSSAPHVLHRVSQTIPRVVRFLDTGSVPERNYHTKCLNFGGHFRFQEKDNNGLILGP